MIFDSIRAGQTQPSCHVVACLDTKRQVADSHSCILREAEASTNKESRLLIPDLVLQKPALPDRQLGVQP